jgi:hypothetical protein
MPLARKSDLSQTEGMAPTQEIQWTELQRDPKHVSELVDRGDVRVKRRDGADLLLTREDRSSSLREGAMGMARALRNMLVHHPSVAREALVEQYAWLDVFPPEAIDEFAVEFGRATEAAAELGQWEVVAQLLRAWKATAAIEADPDLRARLTAPLTGDFGRVPSPMET